ncbi:non-heme ferritin [Gilliamella sp. ESL0441]|uniref:non-heme ferritin n=1 Tax=unclassified Gilliamella TaxID=2685620 RepID=UPI00080E8D81|nr:MULTISPECIES: non-heme ferritin [Gilliamella]OCF96958.1 ferritin [Gilliamella apicola]QYN43483.1 non-heme ferritin [Gilliamella sp. ESL0441]
MLTDQMVKKLNEQLNLEFYSSNLYLQMSAWCDDQNFPSFGKFLRDHAGEERQHMERLFDYVLDCGSLALIGKIEAPESQYPSLLELFKVAYQHELKITKAINALVDYALTQKDFSTFNFLQWYVSEQHEEEKLFKSIVDKLELVGENKRDLFFMDKDFNKTLSESGLLTTND